MAIQNLTEKIQGVYENTNNLYPLLKEIGEASGGGVEGTAVKSTGVAGSTIGTIDYTTFTSDTVTVL